MANREKLTDQELNHMLEDLDVAELKAAQGLTKAAIGLRRLRKKLGLSQEEAAMKCGITPYMLDCLEHGEWNIGIETLHKYIYRLAPDAVQGYSIKYQGEELYPFIEQKNHGNADLDDEIKCTSLKRTVANNEHNRSLIDSIIEQRIWFCE